MPRRPRVEPEKDYVIYILLSPTDKKFFVGSCQKESIRETYRHNIKGRRDSTRQFIQEIAPDRPCFFVLEELVGTTAQALNLIIVWTKIFLERGYTSFNYASLIEMTDHLYYDNQQLYEQRKNLDTQAICSCKNCVLPTYKNKTCQQYLPYITEGDDKI